MLDLIEIVSGGIVILITVFMYAFLVYKREIKLWNLFHFLFFPGIYKSYREYMRRTYGPQRGALYYVA